MLSRMLYYKSPRSRCVYDGSNRRSSLGQSWEQTQGIIPQRDQTGECVNSQFLLQHLRILSFFQLVTIPSCLIQYDTVARY